MPTNSPLEIDTSIATNSPIEAFLRQQSILTGIRDKAKFQAARNQAFPSDREGRELLLEHFNNGQVYSRIRTEDPRASEKIRTRISNYTKDEFNKFLDERNFLTDKDPAELSALNNSQYISALDAEVIQTNDFSILYAQVIHSLYVEYRHELTLEGLNATLAELTQAEREIRAAMAAAAIPLGNLIRLVSTRLDESTRSQAVLDIPIPSKKEVLDALKHAKEFTESEKEVIKNYIYNASLPNSNISDSEIFEVLIRDIYSNIEPSDRNIIGLLNFINNCAKGEDQKLKQKEQEILPKLKRLIESNQGKVEKGDNQSCMVCGESFKDLSVISSLLSCGHRIHLPCMTTYIATTLLMKAEQSDYADPTCPYCKDSGLMLLLDSAN